MASFARLGSSFLVHLSPQKSHLQKPYVLVKGTRKADDYTRKSDSKCINLFKITAIRDNTNNSRINGLRRNSFGLNGGFGDPAKALERLFLQTQKLEEQVTASSEEKGYENGLNLVDLEADLQAALAAFRAKEEELHSAEHAVLLDKKDVELARKNLEFREREIQDALKVQKKLEEELQKVKEDFASQSRDIKEAKRKVLHKEREILNAQNSLIRKEEELENLKRQLLTKDEEIFKASAEVRFKEGLVSQANGVIRSQRNEIRELNKVLKERELLLIEAQKKHEDDADKLRMAQASLEKRMVAWFLAQQDFKRLLEETDKYRGKFLATDEQLKRSQEALNQVMEELKCSKQSLEESRQRLQTQENLLQSERIEIQRQKDLVSRYQTSLMNAESEVKIEREKLKASETCRQELEQHLVYERRTVAELEQSLERERKALGRSVEQVGSLKKELEEKDTAVCDLKRKQEFKESELVSARLELQKLKSDVSVLQQRLTNKDSELSDAQKAFDHLHEEISELKSLMRQKEDTLLKTVEMLKAKKEHVKLMQLDLDDNRIKLSEATSAVEHIADLTRKLADSAKEGKISAAVDENSMLAQANYEILSTNRMLAETRVQLHHIQEMSVDDMKKRKHVEAELDAMKATLRKKEKELLESQRALNVKENELSNIISQWEAREKELVRMRDEVIEEAKSLHTLHALVQERVGDKTLGELALEKLHLEAAHVEMEAAITALRSLADLTRDMLKETKTSVDISADNVVVSKSGFGTEKEESSDMEEDLPPLETRLVERDEAMDQTKKAVKNLSKLTRKLINEAGIRKSQTNQ